MIWCIDYTQDLELKFINVEANSLAEARDQFEFIFGHTHNIEEISCVCDTFSDLFAQKIPLIGNHNE